MRMGMGRQGGIKLIRDRGSVDWAAEAVPRM